MNNHVEQQKSGRRGKNESQKSVRKFQIVDTFPVDIVGGACDAGLEPRPFSKTSSQSPNSRSSVSPPTDGSGSNYYSQAEADIKCSTFLKPRLTSDQVDQFSDVSSAPSYEVFEELDTRQRKTVSNFNSSRTSVCCRRLSISVFVVLAVIVLSSAAGFYILIGAHGFLSASSRHLERESNFRSKYAGVMGGELRYNTVFNDSLRDKTSPYYKELRDATCRIIASTYEFLQLQSCDVVGLRQGSVIASFNITFGASYVRPVTNSSTRLAAMIKDITNKEAIVLRYRRFLDINSFKITKIQYFLRNGESLVPLHAQSLGPISACRNSLLNLRDKPKYIARSDSNCSQFIMCDGAQGFTFSCPAGTLWSPKVETCAHFKDVKCGLSTDDGDDTKLNKTGDEDFTDAVHTGGDYYGGIEYHQDNDDESDEVFNGRPPKVASKLPVVDDPRPQYPETGSKPTSNRGSNGGGSSGALRKPRFIYMAEFKAEMGYKLNVKQTLQTQASDIYVKIQKTSCNILKAIYSLPTHTVICNVRDVQLSFNRRGYVGVTLNASVIFSNGRVNLISESEGAANWSAYTALLNHLRSTTDPLRLQAKLKTTPLSTFNKHNFIIYSVKYFFLRGGLKGTKHLIQQVKVSQSAVYLCRRNVQSLKHKGSSHSLTYVPMADSACRIFLICDNDEAFGFQCPDSTLWNDKFKICDYHSNFVCKDISPISSSSPLSPVTPGLPSRKMSSSSSVGGYTRSNVQSSSTSFSDVRKVTKKPEVPDDTPKEEETDVDDSDAIYLDYSGVYSEEG